VNAPANAVELKQVVKRYGDFVAVHKMDLEIADGSFVTLLGPSGCGKTTTLRMVAGLEGATEGDIYIKGRRVNDVPIHKRNLGIVFQNYALFPHKTIFDNVAFGLKYRDVDKQTTRKRVMEALELVRLPHTENRLPSQLSGGQQQRIALARAIVIQPDVLLLDEPLSALDANLREEMRVELKRIQRELGVTSIFVTHDQAEALAMSDKVIVMSDGWKEQEGSPEEVYNRPVSRFVADFLGTSNFLEGTISTVESERISVRTEDGLEIAVADAAGRSAGDEVRVVVRAEKVALSESAGSEEDATVVDGKVMTVDYQGLAARYFVSVNDRNLQAINGIDKHPFREGQSVKVRIRAEDCVVLDEPAHVD